MTLELALKILGWIFVIGPAATFISIGFYMIKGASNDDPAVKGLALLGITLFFMGIIMLLLLYLTDVFKIRL